jgi:N-acyl-D-aspartate/D-glutamate deacylase
MPDLLNSQPHFAAQLTWDAALRPSPALGLTTAKIGNFGSTIALCRPADRDLTMCNLV